MTSTQKNQTFDNISFLKILIKWKWQLIIVSVVALLAGAIAANFIIKPKFKSTCLVYPSNVQPYSDESETEQLVQWMKAGLVQEGVIQDLDLGNHYGISKDYKYYQSTVDYLYNKNVKIGKTMFESVEISVTDKDPVMAYNIVNKIIEHSNKVILNAQAIKFKEVSDAYEEAIAAKKEEIQKVKEEFTEISKDYYLFNLESQGREFTRGLLRGSSNTEAFNKMKKGIEEKSGDVAYLYNRFENLDLELSELILKYDQARVDFKRPFSFSNMISDPQIADKRYFPKTVFIMFYFFVASFALAMCVILAWEYRQKFINAVKENDN